MQKLWTRELVKTKGGLLFCVLTYGVQSFIGESMPGFRKMIPVKDTLSSRTKDYHQETNSFIHGDAYLLRQSYSKFRRIRRGSTDS